MRPGLKLLILKPSSILAMHKRNQNGFPYRSQVVERSFVILNVLAENREDLSLADMESKVNFY